MLVARSRLCSWRAAPIARYLHNKPNMAERDYAVSEALSHKST
jgi:hypothetical protein